MGPTSPYPKGPQVRAELLAEIPAAPGQGLNDAFGTPSWVPASKRLPSKAYP